MIKKISQIIKGSNNRHILIDVTYIITNQPKHIVVFSHGFKGFKDWGPFNKIAEYFALNQFVFVKFNFSHNGTTLEDPSDFNDLEAFGHNNFSKELDDLSLVLDWIKDNDMLGKEMNKQYISLFGHSRGGAISILKAGEDNTIKKVVSWASPANLINRLPSGEQLDKWRQTNVVYVFNGRTKQNMPMYFQFFKDCKENINRIDIKKIINKINIPHLVVHGGSDSTVSISEAKLMKSWSNNIRLHIVPNADHVFGGYHPYKLKEFPEHLQEAVNITVAFLES